MNQGARKHFFNQNYFEHITTQEQAYWLGLIAADGCISYTTKEAKEPNRLYLNMTEKDKNHLLKFKKAINHTADLIIQSHEKSYSSTPLYYLHCNSTKMCEDLARYSIHPRKTGKSKLPLLPDELIRHFIRGYFDGDGCISIYKQKDKRAKHYPDRLKQEFSFTSDRQVLEQIQKILMKECNLPQTKLKEYKRTEKAVTLRYGGKQQIIRIFHYLYDDATIYLQRKKDKFSLLFSQEAETIFLPSS